MRIYVKGDENKKENRVKWRWVIGRTIYELTFYYWDENPENDDETFIAVYSAYELAQKGLEKFAEQPRFKGKREALFISEHELNVENSFWAEGFFTDE